MRVRVSDYKTGAEPKQAAQMVIGRGTELQRVVYASAARQLLPGNPRIVSRLFFLGAERPRDYRLHDVDAAIAEVATHVGAAVALLRQGIALPAPMRARPGTTFGWRCRHRLRLTSSSRTAPSCVPSAILPAYGARDDGARRSTGTAAGAHRSRCHPAGRGGGRNRQDLADCRPLDDAAG